MERKHIIYAITSAALITVAMICTMVTGNNNESLQVLDEVIIENSAENNVTIISEPIADEVIENETQDADQPNDQVATFVMAASEDGEEISPYDIIKHEIEMIKAADADMVAKYFGTGSAFDPAIVSDRLTATIISFVSTEKVDVNKHNVVLHVCTLDYNKMNQDMLELRNTITDEKELNIEIAKGVVNGNYDLHYTIPVTVENCAVVVTEEIKQALTGGWYTGVGTALANVECPVN